MARMIAVHRLEPNLKQWSCRVCVCALLCSLSGHGIFALLPSILDDKVHKAEVRQVLLPRSSWYTQCLVISWNHPLANPWICSCVDWIAIAALQPPKFVEQLVSTQPGWAITSLTAFAGLGRTWAELPCGKRGFRSRFNLGHVAEQEQWQHDWTFPWTNAKWGKTRIYAPNARRPRFQIHCPWVGVWCLLLLSQWAQPLSASQNGIRILFWLASKGNENPLPYETR